MAGRHEVVKRLFSCFVLEEQSALIPEWNKKQDQRVVIVFFLIFFLRVEQLVNVKSRLG